MAARCQVACAMRTVPVIRFAPVSTFSDGVGGRTCSLQGGPDAIKQLSRQCALRTQY
jgi:hypothetical protein